MIRRPRPEELVKLRELHAQRENEFNFPEIELLSSLYVVTDNNDNIIGFGAVQPIFESVIVIDKTQSLADRVAVFEQLLNKAYEEMHEQGISQLHAFVQDTKFENFLIGRYGFVPTKGTALVKKV